MKEIQEVLTKPDFKKVYYLRENGEVKEITKEEYYKLHDESWSDKTITVHPHLIQN